MKVAIIYGGKSSEHEVSLVSASSVARQIDKSKYEVSLIAITKKGQWFLQPESELERIANDEDASFTIIEDEKNAVCVVPGLAKKSFILPNQNGKSLDIDVVFPVVHGTFCEDGTLQGLLEYAGLPYVGCGVMASAVTMDKEKTKQIWEQSNLPVVPYKCLKRCDLADSKKYDALVLETINTLHFPLFVKPCNAGSSVGASKAQNEKELSLAILDAFNYDNKILIEKSINAREIECSVTGNVEIESSEDDANKVKAYVPGEIAPNHEFYDYDAKYNDPNGADLLIPANLSDAQIIEIQELAVKAYKALDASGLSRIDFFINKDDNKLYLNEINTIPGFTSISMFPKMCEIGGLKYKDLIDLLLTEAVNRFKAKDALKTSR